MWLSKHFIKDTPLVGGLRTRSQVFSGCFILPLTEDGVRMSILVVRFLFFPEEMSKRKTNTYNKSKLFALVEGKQSLQPSWAPRLQGAE